jgi:DNA-binding PadR family transcriptional regulator
MATSSGKHATPCNCTALRKATRRVSQLYDAALEPAGLKTLTHNLKPLERDGLVKITTDPKDRRHRIIALTAAGRARLAQSDALWARAQRGFEAAFGAAKSAALRKALEYVVSDAFALAFNDLD